MKINEETSRKEMRKGKKGGEKKTDDHQATNGIQVGV
jgi:hypothetical protein